jgi:hypothetical protein
MELVAASFASFTSAASSATATVNGCCVQQFAMLRGAAASGAN